MIKSIKYFVRQSWLLIAASFIFGLLLAVTNAAWEPKIMQNEDNKFKDIAGGMLTEAVKFITTEEFEADSGNGKKLKTDIKKAINADGECIGWAFVCQGPGFADKIKLVVAVDSLFEKLAGFGVLASNETPGFGDRIKNDYYREQFTAAPTTELVLLKIGDPAIIDNEIIAISGATVSSEAVVKILNNYIEQVKTYMLEKGAL